MLSVLLSLLWPIWRANTNMRHQNKLAIVVALVVATSSGALLFASRDHVSVPTAFSPQTHRNERPSWPPAIGGPDITKSSPEKPSALRARIVNAVDLNAAIKDIDVNSPTEAKLAAVDVLLACNMALRAKVKPKEGTPEFTAWDELTTRCGAIAALKRKDTLQRAESLQIAADSDDSRLGQLNALSQRSLTTRTLLQQNDLTLLTEALKSNDVLLVREATRTTYAQLNDGSPDSRVRSQALLLATELYRMDQATQFDHLVACANQGRCSAGWPSAQLEKAVKDPRELTEARRMVDVYRLALQQGITAPELLNLR